ncbi:MAG: DnaB-like helicase N-terminal domain-containing protein [Gemmataceae bacterium]
MNDSIPVREAWFADEMRVVGVLLSERGRVVVADVAERVTAEDFGNGDLGDVFRVALDLWREGKAPDVGIIAARVPRATPALLAECLSRRGRACMRRSMRNAFARRPVGGGFDRS